MYYEFEHVLLQCEHAIIYQAYPTDSSTNKSDCGSLVHIEEFRIFDANIDVLLH